MADEVKADYEQLEEVANDLITNPKKFNRCSRK